MTLEVAIHHDDYTSCIAPDLADTSSPRWASVLEDAGYAVRWVDVYKPDIIAQLQGCSGFMWRWAHFDGMYRVARRLFPVVEHYLRIPTYPDFATAWHYDDKIAQTYLLQSLKIPFPQTRVFHIEYDALHFAETAEYPQVLKLSTGAGSSNTKLIRNIDEAVKAIRYCFNRWHHQLNEESVTMQLKSRVVAAKQQLMYGVDTRDSVNREISRGSVIFQEFLPGNSNDTRVTVIGNRAFAYRRWNRANDFRASGSGNIDVDPEAIDKRFVEAAFDAAGKLKTQSCAFDGLYRDGEVVFCEISYTFANWAVEACPGHWVRESYGGEPEWKSGRMWPEIAQVEDFIGRMRETER